MMVNTHQMHKTFIESLKNQIAKNNDDIKSYKKLLLSSTKKLVELKKFIEQSLNDSYENILTYKSKQKVNALNYDKKINRLKRNNKQLTYVKLIINKLVFYKVTIDKLTKTNVSLKAKIIPFKEYKFLVSNFNETISDLIIKEGYVFRLGHRLGQIRIQKKARSKKLPVNWLESNKTKQAIINAGEIPYHKDTAPNGKKWLVYFNDKYGYYWFWSKFQCACPNRDFYSFNPTAGDYGNIKKLNQYRKHNPTVTLKYKK